MRPISLYPDGQQKAAYPAPPGLAVVYRWDANRIGGREATPSYTLAAMDSSQTTVDVDDGGGGAGNAPLDDSANVPFLIQVDAEIMLVTAVADLGGGDYRYTIVRGYKGTTAAAHGSGAYPFAFILEDGWVSGQYSGDWTNWPAYDASLLDAGGADLTDYSPAQFVAGLGWRTSCLPSPAAGWVQARGRGCAVVSYFNSGGDFLRYIIFPYLIDGAEPAHGDLVMFSAGDPSHWQGAWSAGGPAYSGSATYYEGDVVTNAGETYRNVQAASTEPTLGGDAYWELLARQGQLISTWVGTFADFTPYSIGDVGEYEGSTYLVTGTIGGADSFSTSIGLGYAVLVAAKGDQGVAGSTWLDFGSGTPTGGVDGDFAFVNDSGAVWYKSAGTWTQVFQFAAAGSATGQVQWRSSGGGLDADNGLVYTPHAAFVVYDGVDDAIAADLQSDSYPSLYFLTGGGGAGVLRFNATQVASFDAGGFSVDAAQLLLSDGTAADPAIEFRGDPGTGFHLDAPGYLNLDVGGASHGQFAPTSWAVIGDGENARVYIHDGGDIMALDLGIDVSDTLAYIDAAGTPGGGLSIRVANTERILLDGTGIGLFGVAPVAQAALIANLTNSMADQTADGDLEALPTVSDAVAVGADTSEVNAALAAIERNLTELDLKWAALNALIIAIGIEAAS